jgi:hypothetical protein
MSFRNADFTTLYQACGAAHINVYASGLFRYDSPKFQGVQKAEMEIPRAKGSLHRLPEDDYRRCGQWISVYSSQSSYDEKGSHELVEGLSHDCL